MNHSTNDIELPGLVLKNASVETHQTMVVDIPYAPNRRVFDGRGRGVKELMSCEGAMMLIRAGVGVPRATHTCVSYWVLSDGRHVVMCDELSDNLGTSITNAWPGLAEYLHEMLHLPDDKVLCVFLERYGTFSYKGNQGIVETIDRVDISWAGDKATACGWKRVRYGSKDIADESATS